MSRTKPLLVELSLREQTVYVVSLLMVSLWIVGISSPRDPGAMIHLLLVSAVALLLVKIFETPERRERDVRWPPWPSV